MNKKKRKHDDDGNDDDDDDDDDGYFEEDEESARYSVVESEFLRQARRGVILSLDQLVSFCKRNRIPYKLPTLKKLRVRFKFSAMHSRTRRPLRYMAASVLRPGVIQFDFAHYRPELKKSNDGAIGFLLGVDVLTQYLVILPLRDQTTRSWKKAILAAIEGTFNQVTVIYTDQDSAIKSGKESGFRAYLKKNYDIDWHFLKMYSKAFLSERYIFMAKSHLSQSMKAAKTERWVDFVEPLCKHHNSSFLKGTNLVRKDITIHNYLSLIDQLVRAPSPTLLFNFGTSPAFPTALAKYVWKFRPGSKVMLRRKVNYKLKNKNTFEKVSVVGGFGPDIFTVSECNIKNSGRFFITPTYKLREIGGSFYQSDLVEAGFLARRTSLKRKRRRRRIRGGKRLKT